MLTFISAPIHLFVSANPFMDLSPSTFSFTISESNSRKGSRKRQSLRIVAAKESGSLSGFVFLDARRRNFRRRCKRDWESEGDFELEAEILKFMKNSKNPEAFPSKKELTDAGRMDLVEAILKQGGWLAFGWDLNDNESYQKGFLDDGDIKWGSTRDRECNNDMIQEKVLESNQERSFDFSNSASSSGRTLETAAEDDSGIDGILSRLEKERNMNFGFGLRDRGYNTHVQSNDLKHDWLTETSKNVTVTGLKRNCRPASLNPNNGVMKDSVGKFRHRSPLSNVDGFRNSLEPDMWRTWSIQRAGNSDMEFEGGEVDALGDKLLQIGEATGASSNRRKETSYEAVSPTDIRTRLQHLELELSTVLHTLKSNSSESLSTKGDESSSDDLLKLSDAWEFQENEIMSAQDKLRSIRAKLAVIEGKMALAIIDAQKIAEEKQKRIDDAQRALRLLRTACIVWPNSASEVLLAGSFDGWATQRKMEKSSTGIFSLYLKLYPGRYEIKFIVDGEWRIDPLRPIVYNSGHQNNLLIIS